VGDIVQQPEFGSALAVIIMLLMIAAVTINNSLLTIAQGGRSK
jgi:putative spermidine/putrescine transport system permease protein